MKTFVAVLTLIFLCFLSNHCYGAETPEQAVEKYYASLQQNELNAASDFLHPAEAERAKAALYAALERDQNLPGESLKDAFFGKKTTFEQIRSLPANEFIRVFFSQIPSDFQVSKILTSYQVLGGVKEDEMTHVLVRLKFRADLPQTSKLQVVTLLPYLGGWRMTMPDEFNRVIAGINQAIDRKSKK